ncbi:3-oxoacyl [Sphaceloma murrayae]|uniref:3-oxoacyl n=1 Tax=Sphaceloma murrayae TaxID=2082308 RepID=A0A2K1R037_9PEZI|nr:3-oxoacyl [Sphaceloma murrayae]
MRSRIKTVVADINLTAAQAYVEALNEKHSGSAASGASTQVITSAVQVDITRWDSQVKAFEASLAFLGGQIDYVFAIAGIGERAWLPKLGDLALQSNGNFVKPDLSVIDANLVGTLHTVSLAVQQMQRQEPDAGAFRGRIAVAASVCGFYCVPSLPVYTAAKHGVIGFVRSYGKLLAGHGIALNAVCPLIVRTAISREEFYEDVEARGLVVPMEKVVAAFRECMSGSTVGGECLEVGPKTDPFDVRGVAGYLDLESEESCNLLNVRAMSYHV